ncbi:prenyltransferase/squalene oxidase repeat-containing protein [Kitasatospora sp. NPDC127111]|uniref:prenyltransferase/squalene oxidase repeat-containing protein n=1 Tax=Kitasatospora sp. NPDC127111 TaxID=3345363 RepID=UPI00362DBB37
MELLGALESRVISRVDPGGAVREACRSRSLESALALRLVERFGSEEPSGALLRAYLEAQLPGLEGVERMLAEAALGGRRLAWDAAREWLVRAPGFTADRKRALLEMLAVVFDDRHVPVWDERAFEGAALHSWALVQMTAVKVVVAVAAGQSERVTDEDVRRLMDTQRAPHVWEGNVLLHLSVLHALVRLPGTEELVLDGLRKLMAHQRADGGLPFVSDTDTWCTATAGVALASVGTAPYVLHRLAGHLVGRQLPAGGWAYTDLSCQTDVDDTSVAVQFLHVLDAERYAGAISRGIRSLHAVRGEDGGFPTYTAGTPSEASMTAAVTDALTVRPTAHGPVIAKALRFLACEQREDGSFPPDWSSSRLHTVFRVLLAARRTASPDSAVQRMVRRSADLVRGQQNGDGGWGQQAGDASDVVSTAYGLTALCALPDADPESALAAADFLVRRRTADGGLDAVPDSIGPRPFVFAVPALPEIFTLLALGHLSARFDPAAGTGLLIGSAAAGAR